MKELNKTEHKTIISLVKQDIEQTKQYIETIKIKDKVMGDKEAMQYMKPNIKHKNHLERILNKLLTQAEIRY